MTLNAVVEGMQRCKEAGNSHFVAQRWDDARLEYTEGIRLVADFLCDTVGARAAAEVSDVLGITTAIDADGVETVTFSHEVQSVVEDEPAALALLVTLLSNRAGALLAMNSALSDFDALYLRGLDVVRDTTMATNIIRAHYTIELRKPCSIVPVAQPLVNDAIRSKIMFRRAKGLQLIARAERQRAREMLSSPPPLLPSPSSSMEYFELVSTRLRSSTTAALDALTLMRKSLQISADAAAVERELMALRSADVFPSAAFVHPLLDKVCGGGVVKHGVGMLVAAPARSEDPMVNGGNGGPSGGGGGLGGSGGAAVAAGVVPRGSLLLREFPVIHVPDISGMQYSTRFAAALEKMLEVFEKKAPAKQTASQGAAGAFGAREQILSLHFELQDNAHEWLQFALCDIWRRNSMKIAENDFRIGEGDRGPEGVGLYLDASRFNHSCRPNAVQYFDQKTGELSVRALRDIRPNEEVTIAYVSPFESPERKREVLGFDCECEFCFGDDGFGQHVSHLVCPQCRVTSKPITTIAAPGSIRELEAGETSSSSSSSPSSTTPNDAPTPRTLCGMCRFEIPLREYLAAVKQRRKEATDLCICDGDVEKNRLRALRLLLGIEDGASLLAPCHYLRFQVRLEALAAAVGAPLTLELSLQVGALAKKTLAAASEVLPSRWPLTTGLIMHNVYCHGRHIRGTTLSLTSSDGASTVSEKLLITAEVCKWLSDAFEDHVVLAGDGPGALESFWRRYEAELAAVGIMSPKDFERVVLLGIEATSSREATS